MPYVCNIFYSKSLGYCASFDVRQACVFISDKPRSLAQKREPLGTVNSLTGFPEKYKKIGFVAGISEGAFFLSCLGPNEHISTDFACVAIMPQR